MDEWGINAFSFYTTETAARLSDALANLSGGKLVMSVAELPFKYPVAPIEFIFLADWYFRQKGIRNKVELTLSTPFIKCMPNWPKGRLVMQEAAMSCCPARTQCFPPRLQWPGKKNPRSDFHSLP